MATNTQQLDIIVRAQDDTTVRLKSIESSIIRFVGAVSSALSALTVSIFPIKEAAELQKELLNVAKTTNFTEIQIAALSEGLAELSTRINVTATQLAKIAAIGGQLGLGGEGVEGIRQFTETTARFASVIDVTVEEAGTGIAKLLNVFKINVREAERVSSLLNEISNNSTASGRDLLDIINRIGTAGGTLNIKQAAALAALGKDLGLTTETVGTSFQKIFLNLQTETDKLAKVIGIPVDVFAAKVKSDGVGALKLAIDAIRQLDRSVQATFAEEVFGGGKIFGLFTNLLNDKDFRLLDSRLKNAEDGFEGGTSAIQEMDRVSQGLGYQITLLTNGIRNLAITVGSEALPYLTELAKAIQTALRDPAFIDNLVQMGRQVGNFVRSIIDGVRAVSQFSDALGPLARAIQLFIQFKIAGFFFGMAQGLYRMAVEARNSVTAFLDLARGHRVVAESAEAAAKSTKKAVDAATLSPNVARVGQAIGTIPRTSEASKTIALEAQNQATREQVQLRTQMVAQSAADAKQQAAIVTLQNEQRVVEARRLAIKAGAARLYKEELADLGRRSVLIREALAAESNNLVILRAENAALLQQQQLRTANAVAEAAKAKASVISVAGAAGQAAAGILGAVTRGLAAFVRGAAAVLFSWQTALAITAYSLLGFIFGFDKVNDFFARMIGYSGTAAQKAEQDRRIAAIAAEKEKVRIEQLASEYDKLKDVIEGISPDSLDSAVRNNSLIQYLQTLQRYVEVTDAKIKDTSRTINDFGRRGALLRQEISATEESIRDQETLIRSIEADLGQARYDKSQGATYRYQQTVEGLTASLEAAKSKLAEMKASVVSLSQAESFVATRRAAQIKEQESQFNNLELLYGKLAPVVTLDKQGTLTLLDRAAALAKQREQVTGLTKDLVELRQKAKSNADDKKTLNEVAVAEQRLATAEARLRSINASYREFYLGTSEAAKFVLEAIGDPLDKTSQKFIQSKELFEQMLAGQTGPLNTQIDAAVKSIKKLDDELAILERRQEQRREDGTGFIAGLIESDEELRKRIALRTQERNELRQNLAVLQRMLEISSRIAEVSKERGLTEGDLRKQVVEMGIAAGVTLANLKRIQETQKVLVDTAKSVAATWESEYQKATKAVGDAVRNTTTLMLNFQKQIKDNLQELEITKFQERETRQQKDLAEAISFVSDAIRESGQKAFDDPKNEKRQSAVLLEMLSTIANIRSTYGAILRAQGQSGDELEKNLRTAEAFAAAIKQRLLAGADAGAQNFLDLFTRISAKVNETFTDVNKGSSELSVKQLQFQQIEQSIYEIQARLTREIATQSTLREQLDRAKAANDQASIARIQEQLKYSYEQVQLDRESLKTKQSQLQQLAKPVSGEFFGTGQVDPAAIEKSLRLTQDLTKQVSQSSQQTAALLATIASGAAAAASTALSKTETAIVDATSKLNEASRITKLAAEAFQLLGQRMQASARETEGATRNLEGIRERLQNFNLTSGIALPDIANLERALAESSKQLGNLASSRATEVAALARSNSELAAAFNQAFNTNLFSQPSLKQQLDQLLSKSEAKLKGLFDPKQLHDAAQSALDESGPVTLRANVSGSGVVTKAGGGYIQGAGTSTSDSIPAWLSHGEYVMDARSTRMFGPGFFRFLQLIAKRGSGAARSFVDAFGSVPLPKYATGGLVPAYAAGFAEGGLAGGEGVGAAGGFMAITLKAGDKKARLFSTREDARNLVEALKHVGLGTE